jgi:hypothetical protein
MRIYCQETELAKQLDVHGQSKFGYNYFSSLQAWGEDNQILIQN